MFLAVPMIAMIHFHAIRRESSSLALADHLEKFELPDSDDMQRSPLGRYVELYISALMRTCQLCGVNRD